MSILGSHSNNNSSSHSSKNMTSSNSFFELKKQASFFIKEKIKTARLALTDVTPVQLLTEEAINANPWAPDTRTLGLISRSAFEVDDYWRIVDILHNRLSKFDKRYWRSPYNALIVLEHLLTHGPESVAEEFQTEKPIIKVMENFQHVDERGFNWGLAMRKKCERLLKLLEKGPLLKGEREHARKLTREIKGFGSFTGKGRSTSPLSDSSMAYGRSHSQFNEHGNEENVPQSKGYTEPPLNLFDDSLMKRSSKENMAPKVDTRKGDLHIWSDDGIEEGNPLIRDGHGGIQTEEDDHPFNDTETHGRVSLLTAQTDD